MAEQNVCAVVGVGPGLGASVSKRFASEGYALALFARDPEHIDPVRSDIEAEGGVARSVACDAGDPASVSRAFSEARAELGDPDVLVYNAGAFEMAGVLDLAPETFERAWRANCFGAFLAAQEVLPRMLARGRGTLLLTGATASLRGGAKFSALAVGKFGLRALAQSLAREYGKEGVHVAHVIIDGQIDTPRVRQMFPERAGETFLSPDAIADTYWDLHAQPRTTWTLELDLRPAVESF